MNMLHKLIFKLIDHDRIEDEGLLIKGVLALRPDLSLGKARKALRELEDAGQIKNIGGHVESLMPPLKCDYRGERTDKALRRERIATAIFAAQASADAVLAVQLANVLMSVLDEEKEQDVLRLYGL